MPETRFFDVRGASRDELDPFASGSYEDYELTASGLLGQFRQTDIQRVRVVDAYITGVLDLRAVDGTLDLAFERCRFEYPPDVRLAKLIGLRFSRCWLPGLKARSLRTRDDLHLTRCVVEFEPDDVEIEETTTGHDRGRGMPNAAVNLTDAVIDGSVVLTRTLINHPRGKAIQADRARITGALLACRMEVNGEVRIPGLRTGGNGNFSGATLNNPDGFALNGNGLHIGGSLLCEVDNNYGLASWRKRFSANGILYLPSATVDSDIVLREARLMVNQHGPIAVAAWKSNDPYLDPRPALVADRLKVDGNLELSDGLQATGTLRMVNARIGGSLRLAGAEVKVARGARTPFYDRALHLDGSEIGGDIEATSLRVPAGQIRLADVTVGGNVLAWNTMFLHPGRDVLSARRTRIAGNLHLTDATVQGTLQLQGVEVGGSLNLYGTELTEPEVRGSSSFSLDVRTACIGHDLVLTEDKDRSFRATGGVNLDGAQVARRVDLRGAVLGSLPLHGIALDASGAAAREFLLTPSVPPKGRLVLRRAHCGTFGDNLAFWHATGGVELDDFRYDALSAGDTLDLRPPDQRIALLRLAMGGYRPGPYDQLATTLRAAGDEDQASTVLLKKQQFGYSALAQRFTTFGFMVVFWSWLQRVISGYGFRPGRFVGWLLVVLAAAVTLLGSLVSSCWAGSPAWLVATRPS